ncbi:pitrilysin family protein [Deinococcus deserti]|uniref:Putative peptidase M16 n=1 Tax=Deinococcus deserti (strain DSM 17065 / CIP 109153 / LMG 22923 / VCD115) TaxID=546414 RepID=C1CZN1_DEIDV|nr:pitrilysin family protein [Deinococcus deserti]ACO47279.1 putative peptidase M16 [Deinococcus deserti VCD115]
MPARSPSPPAPAPSAQLWTLPGGLRVAFERRSGPGFAFDLRVPVGNAHDPPGQEGAAGVLEEWLFKGAAGLDARALQDAFDDLGVRRGGGVGPEATRFTASGLSADLGAALRLTASVLVQPELPDAELPVLTDLARQDLEGLADSPSDLLAVHARQLAFPPPAGSPFAGFAHPASGTPGGLQALTPAGLRAHLGRYGQAGSVLGLVADLEPADAFDLVHHALGELRPGQDAQVPAVFRAGGRAHHTDADAEQTHLSITAPGVAPVNSDWLAWQVALTALSGGSASRLFTAVREERGLAYAVSASSVLLGGQGFLSVYAGSTPDRAPETLEVVLNELSRLPQGLEPEEFRRACTGLTTSVVFGAESLRGRAGSLTRDIAVFGRVRPIPELRARLAALTLEDVNAFLAGYDPAAHATVTTLGPVDPGGSSLAAEPSMGAEARHV